MSQALVKAWYRGHWALMLLWPLALLFEGLRLLRRALFALGVLKTTRLPAPVIVVGNITVGGSGKTPVVLWLAERLAEWGFKPGIVSRGYGGRAPYYPYAVQPDSAAVIVGDEPLLLARRSGVPVIIDPKRPRGGAALVALGCDLIISDDGLQHYALARDVELVIIDGQRRFGNGWPLPAGPMREPRSRLRRVHAVICNGGTPMPGEYAMRLMPAALRALQGESCVALADWAGRRVHAVAGIGAPARFFEQLRALGLTVVEHAFPDHHAYCAADFEFGDDAPIVMTEKDGVKAQGLLTDSLAARCWLLPVSAQIDPAFLARLRQCLNDLGAQRG